MANPDGGYSISLPSFYFYIRGTPSVSDRAIHTDEMADNRRILIVALFLMALGAFSLHSRIHPVFVKQIHDTEHKHQTTATGSSFNGTHFLASLFCFIDLVFVTWLFCSKRTVTYAFLLNGMLAIMGIILMGHFTIAHLWGTGAGFWDWVYLKSTSADIVILMADFLVGKAIFDSYTG